MVPLPELGYFTASQAARLLGTSPRSVRRLAERGVIERTWLDVGRLLSVYPARQVIVAALERRPYEDVFSPREIAEVMGVSERAVRRALAQYGVGDG